MTFLTGEACSTCTVVRGGVCVITKSLYKGTNEIIFEKEERNKIYPYGKKMCLLTLLTPRSERG